MHFQNKTLYFVGIAFQSFGQNVAVDLPDEYVFKFAFRIKSDQIGFAVCQWYDLPASVLQGRRQVSFAFVGGLPCLIPVAELCQFRLAADAFCAFAVFPIVGVIPAFFLAVGNICHKSLRVG